MAKKKRSAAKRPPVHEVILTRLQEIEQELKESRSHVAPLLRWLSGKLLAILDGMHLPEKEESKILAALQGLNADVIGVHRSHARLLKRLSGHSIKHTMGKTAKLKRRRA